MSRSESTTAVTTPHTSPTAMNMASQIVSTYTYVRVLHRAEDAGGLAYWTQRYLKLGDLRYVEASFFASSEAFALAQAAG